jgi:hypothetical protein
MVSLVAVLAVAIPANADWDDRSPGQRAGYTTLAVVENVVPVASAFAAPRCLQGYVLCKLSFAAFSVVAAGEQLFMSGGSDMKQFEAVLHRGWAGDWYLTGAHAAGDKTPEVLPDPGPPANAAPGSGSAPFNDVAPGSGSAPINP